MKVELISYTPDAINLIANAARSTHSEEFTTSWDNCSSEDFIRWLIKQKHLGVLEHCVFTFNVEQVSKTLTHQLVRHRIASYLQQSDRYVEPYNYVTPVSIENNNLAHELFIQHMHKSYELYRKLCACGIKKEDARFVIPGAYMTHVVVTMNARTLRHFFELRMSPHAQWEIRTLAHRMFNIVHDLYPCMFEDLL